MTKRETDQLLTLFADHEAQQTVSNNVGRVFVQDNLTLPGWSELTSTESVFLPEPVQTAQQHKLHPIKQEEPQLKPLHAIQ